MKGLASAASLLTVIGRGSPPNPAAGAWFGVVGLALGAVLGGIWWLAAQVWPPTVAAGIVVLADLALTGMIHVDGLADTADGLLPHMARQRRLEVMGLPDVGAFGVAVLVVVMLLRFATLSTLAPSPLLLAALWGTARCSMAFALSALPYARPGGIADGFAGTRSRLLLVLALALCFAAAMMWSPWRGAVAVLFGIAAAAGVLAIAHRKIGGYTGDVLGASGIVAETAGLIAAAAR